MLAQSDVHPQPVRGNLRDIQGRLALKLHRHRWFLIAVVLPVALATIYYGLIASDEYVSESSFAVRSQTQRPGQMTTIANLIQTTGLSAGSDQTGDVLEYVRSRSALADLAKRFDVRAAFSSRDVDRLSRYPLPFRSDTFENLYKFYNSKVGAQHDKETGLARIEVHAFTPEDAYRINQNLLLLSEEMVNRLNQRAEQRAIDEASRRVAAAETRVRAARAALAGYRNQSQLIDPTKQAAGVLEVANRLISEQAALQAQLAMSLREAPNNPSIPALRARIAAIGAQIGAQNGRAVGGQRAISSKMSQFESLTAEQEFASQNLVAANASLEQARVEAQKQQFYLQRVVEPNRPDMALYPKRLWNILTVAGAAILLYFVAWMLVVGILEHAPED